MAAPFFKTYMHADPNKQPVRCAALFSWASDITLTWPHVARQQELAVTHTNTCTHTHTQTHIHTYAGRCGSLLYMSPEVARGKPYNEKVDVFSFGILAWELLGRSLLSAALPTDDQDALLEHIAKVCVCVCVCTCVHTCICV